MKDSAKIVVIKVIRQSEIYLSGKIVALVLGESVKIPSTMKNKRNVCAIKKWGLFAILIFRVYLFWVKQ